MAKRRLTYDVVANMQQAEKELLNFSKQVDKLQDKLKLGDMEVNLKDPKLDIEDPRIGLKMDDKELNETINKFLELSRKATEVETSINKGLGKTTVYFDTSGAHDELKNLEDRVKKLRTDFNSARTNTSKLVDEWSYGGRGRYQGSPGHASRAYHRARKVARDSAIAPEGTGSAELRKQLANIKRVHSDVVNQRTQFSKAGQIARGSGHMTWAQTKRYKQQIDQFSSEYQGLKPEEGLKRIADNDSISNMPEDEQKNRLSGGSIRRKALSTIDSMTEVEDRLRSELETLEEQYRNNEIGELEKEYQSLDIEENLRLAGNIKKRAKSTIAALDDAFDAVIEEADAMRKAFSEGKEIRTAPDPDSARGRLSSRANAIALAGVLTAVAHLTRTFQKGKAEAEAMRPISQSIGFRTGEDDFRSIRSNAMLSGRDFGYSGQEAMEMADAILGSRGVTSSEDLQSATVDAMAFSKFSGASQETATGLVETLSSSQVNSSDSKALQDAVLGGIKASGMQGREEEQIAALNGIVKNQKDGRSVSADEIGSRIAMSTVISRAGGAGYKGENLQDFMGSADDAIRGADMYSDLGLLLGAGWAEGLQGPEAGYEYKRRREGGLNPENFRTLVGNLSTAYGNNPKILADKVDDALGGVTKDIEGLSNVVSAYLRGELSDEALEEQLGIVSQAGSDEMGRREEAYQDSPDADREYAAANDIIQAVNNSENKLMDILAEVRRISSGIGTGGGFQGLLATFGESLLTASLSTLISGGGLSGLGSLAQKLLKPVMGMDIFTKTAPAAKTFGKDMLGKFTSTAAGSKLSGGVKWAAEGAKSLFGAKTAVEGVKNVKSAKNAADVVKNAKLAKDGAKLTGYTTAASTTTSTLSKAGNIASKVAKPVGKTKIPGFAYLDAAFSAVEGIGRISDAEEGEKGEAVGGTIGKVAGNLGGGALGAKLGGVAGTFLGGPLGTAIGAGLGGMIGSWIGGDIGDSAGSGIGGLFDGDDGQTTGESGMEEAADKSQNMRLERLRESNIGQESVNLDRLEVAIKEISQLLATSSNQNGIIGKGGANKANSKYLTGGSILESEEIANTEAEKNREDSKSKNVENVSINVEVDNRGNNDSPSAGERLASLLSNDINTSFTRELRRV